MAFSLTSWWYLHIYTWADLIEIALFSSVIYYFSAWLKEDKQKPLLLSFYGYCVAITIGHIAHLQTVSSALFLFAPVLLVVFIVLHQDTLQRNFITLHNITPSQTTANDWLELLVRSCLVAVSNNKPISCIIQKRNDLHTLLSCPYEFKCKLSEGLLDLLINSSGFNPKKLIWLKDDGTLQAVNTSWKKNSVDTWLAQEIKEQEQWLQDALFFTAKTDALYCKINPSNRTFTLVAQGKLLEEVSAHAALKTIKKYLGHFDLTTKGDNHAGHHKTTTTEQSFS